MLNPYYGLFQYTRDDIYTLQINPDSAVNPVGIPEKILIFIQKWNYPVFCQDKGPMLVLKQVIGSHVLKWICQLCS